MVYLKDYKSFVRNALVGSNPTDKTSSLDTNEHSEMGAHFAY